MTVRIVTDSSCDLSDAEIADLGVEVVPLSIRFGDEEFVDREELTVDDFFARLSSSDALPSTAAPAPGRFVQAFERQRDAGADAVVCITIANGLSATMQAAQNAVAELGGALPVHVVNSMSVSAGLGTQVMLAARDAKEGMGLDDVVARAEDRARRSHVFAALDTLEYLKKGGRIGGAQAMLGTLLSIKPIIRVGDEVTEAGKQRTRRKSLVWLRDKVRSFGHVEELTVTHGMASDWEEMVELFTDEYDRDQIRVGIIGPVVSSHGGPGVMGVTFLEPR